MASRARPTSSRLEDIFRSVILSAFILNWRPRANFPDFHIGVCYGRMIILNAILH
jgi:hypothetical protein